MEAKRERMKRTRNWGSEELRGKYARGNEKYIYIYI